MLLGNPKIHSLRLNGKWIACWAFFPVAESWPGQVEKATDIEEWACPITRSTYNLRDVPTTFPRDSTMGVSGLMGIESLNVVLEGRRGSRRDFSKRDERRGECLQLDLPREPSRALGQLEWQWRVLGLSIVTLDLPLLICVVLLPQLSWGVVVSWPMPWDSDWGNVRFWETLCFPDWRNTYAGPSFSLPPVRMLVWSLKFWNEDINYSRSTEALPLLSGY